MKWRKKIENHEPTLSLDEQRVAALTHIGSKLSAERVARGLDLYEMILRTKIPYRILQAIETAEVKNLPEPIYTQGFIRIYADELGLNGDELANSYPLGVNRVSLKPNWKGGSGQLRPVHLYLVYVGLICFSVTGFSQFLGATEMRSRNLERETQAAYLENTSPKNINPQRSQVKSSAIAITNQTNGKDVKVGLTLKDSSWVRIEADGKTQFEGVLPQGSQRTWTAQTSLTIRAGNAGGVLVSVNQETARPLGQPGQENVLTVAAANRS